MIEHLSPDTRKNVERWRDMPESRFRRRQSIAWAFWLGVILFGLTIAVLDQWSRGWDLGNPGALDLGGMLTAAMGFMQIAIIEQRDTIRRLALPKVDIHASPEDERTPPSEATA